MRLTSSVTTPPKLSGFGGTPQTASRSFDGSLPDCRSIDRLNREELIAVASHAAAIHARAMALLVAPRIVPPASEPATELLKAKEAAAQLGMSIDWVRRHGFREGIAVRVGARSVRYPRSAIDEYQRRTARSR